MWPRYNGKEEYKLYSNSNVVVATGTAGALGTYQFTDVPAGSGYYATQTINSVESDKSAAVELTAQQSTSGGDPGGGGPQPAGNIIGAGFLLKTITTGPEGKTLTTFTLPDATKAVIQNIRAQQGKVVPISLEEAGVATLAVSVPAGILQNAADLECGRVLTGSQG